jgi:serine/threonine protein kinase/tetratricopeptide (TPR) repeat protein
MTDPEQERDEHIARLLDEALAELRARGSLDVAAWQARYPELGAELPAILDTLRNFETAVDDWRLPTPHADGEEMAATRSLPHPSDSPAIEILPGQIGRYRILERLGAGGMGTVYKAHDPDLQRLVALKVPRFYGPPPMQDQSIQRFLREARAAAAVRHSHVCPLHDVGEQDGLPYVVMAYVEGQSLARRLATQGRYEDPRQAVALVRQVIDALAAVHERGIVHRDLKPGNILLDAAGQALLTDFGLARPEDDEEHLTRDGHLIGTPAYMAPEQARPTPGEVGVRSDLYSLGVVLYQMLSGRVPFEGPLMNVVSRVAEETPPPLSQFRRDLDPVLEAIVHKAMARQPENRYATAAEFAAALDQWSAGAPTVVRDRHPSGTVTPSGQSLIEAGLPDGGHVKVLVQHGATPPGNVTVKIHEEKAKGRRRRNRLVISVSVTVALLLVAPVLWIWSYGTLALMTRSGDPDAIAQHAETELALAKPAVDKLDKAEADRIKAEMERKMALEPGIRALPPKGLPTPEASPPDLRPFKVAAPKVMPQPKDHGGQELFFQGVAPGQNSFQVVAAGDGQLVASARRPTRRQTFDEYAYEKQNLPTPQPQAVAANFNAPPELQQVVRQAEVLRKQGETDQAAKLLQQAIEWSGRGQNTDSLTTAALQNNLAETVYAQGDYGRTAQMYQRSLKVIESRLGTDHPYVLQSRANLAGAYQSLGEYQKAEPLYRQNLSVQQTKLGGEHPEVAASLNNLGVLYHIEGRYQDAQPLYQRALTIYRKNRGEDDTVAQELNNLGLLAASQARAAARRASFVQAVAVCQPFPSPARTDTAGGLLALEAQVEAQAGLLTAVRYCEQALAIRERLLREHPKVLSYREDLAASYINMAFLHQQMGRRENAATDYEKALRVRLSLVQTNPRNGGYVRALAQSYCCEADMAEGADRFADAEKSYRDATALLKPMVAAYPTSPAYRQDLARSLGNLAQVYARMGRKTEAKQTEREAQQIRAGDSPAGSKH